MERQQHIINPHLVSERDKYSAIKQRALHNYLAFSASRIIQ